MDKEVLARNEAEFDSLDALRGGKLPSGRFSVNVNGGSFECLLYRKPLGRLFVILHGARDPRKHPLPVFQRWSWHGLFPGSVLYVSDPTLLLDPERMGLGWYVGTQYADHLSDLTLLVRTVADLLQVDHDRIISYGSSGGGFAALMVAARIDGSTAVSINAQTNVLKYMKEFVGQLLGLGFGGRDPADLTFDELSRMDAVGAFTHAHRSKCLYVQNVQDVSHFKRHFLPFCQATGAPSQGGGSPDGRVIAFLYDDPSAHGAEPRALVPTLVTIAVGLAEDSNRREIIDLVAKSCAGLADDSELLRLERALAPRLSIARRFIPDAMEDFTDRAASVLIREVFRQISAEIVSLEQGTLSFPGLGDFHVRCLESEAGKGDSARRRVRFVPHQPERLASL